MLFAGVREHDFEEKHCRAMREVGAQKCARPRRPATEAVRGARSLGSGAACRAGRNL